MGIIELVEENFLISFAVVLGIGIFQGAILAKGIRTRFPSLKRHARAASVILLILFSINAIANVFKFAIPTKLSVSEIMTPTTPEEGFELLINVLGLNAGFFTVIAMFVTITIILILKFAEISRPFQYFIFTISIIMLILAVVGRFTDYVPTVFQILMYAFYQFGLTLGIFIVSRRKIDELPELK
ncbi:MAG: hypothetical protein ACE5EJ_06890 [Nitrosopumilaceae archaeon]